MIDLHMRDDIAILQLEHGKANALDLEFCQAFTKELGSLTADARAAVVTARGSIFSAGVDLLRILDDGPGYVGRFLTSLSEFVEAVFSFPKPLVAAINGHAIAGGCILSCMADRRLMARGAGRIGVPELLVGVPFPVAPLEVLRFAVPRRYFQEIVYAGLTYEPAEGMERGLIDEIVEPDELLNRAVAIAGDLARLPADAFRLVKEQVRQPALERMRAGARQDEAVRQIWTSPETTAVMRDYVSRTFKQSGA